MSTDQSSQNTSSQEQEESTPKTSLRAERCGVASLLSSLRGDTLELNGLLTSSAPETVKEEEEKELDESEESKDIPENRPLNRKEKRRLQRLIQNEDGDVKRKPLEAIDPAQIPANLQICYCDTTTFDFYKATFGYKSTSENNFVHFSTLSHDGNWAIVASQDRYIRAYYLHETQEIRWKHNTGDLVLDAFWESSGKGVFSSSKHRPIQLFDTESGNIIGTYNGKDSGDNIKEAMSIGQVGTTLIGGFRNNFQLWDIGVAGEAHSRIKLYDKTYHTGIKGKVMTITPHPTMPDLFAAAGTSSSIGIFSVNWKNTVSTIEGSLSGYTNAHFSPDGLKLYASERSGDIHCFDTRMNMLIQVLKRDMQTSHRTRFDIENSGRLLFCGTSSGDIAVFDLHEYSEEIQPVLIQNVASTCVPCVGVKGSRLVLCSGQRIYPDDPMLDDSVGTEACQENKEKSAPKNSFQVFEIL